MATPYVVSKILSQLLKESNFYLQLQNSEHCCRMSSLPIKIRFVFWNVVSRHKEAWRPGISEWKVENYLSNYFLPAGSREHFMKKANLVVQISWSNSRHPPMGPVKGTKWKMVKYTYIQTYIRQTSIIKLFHFLEWNRTPVKSPFYSCLL